MRNLLYKELQLATQPLTFLFLGFTAMTFIPGYPILCGAFFVCLGIFQSFQLSREDNDILYTVLLPVEKTDAVKAKYASVVLLEMIAFGLFSLFTVVRMTFLAQAQPYTANVLLGANPVFLAFVLLIFLAFNVCFLGGFFKTAYRIGKPFLFFSGLGFLLIGTAETLHHLPGLGWLNTLELSGMRRQLPLLLASALLYAAGTAASCRASQKRFGTIDL